MSAVHELAPRAASRADGLAHQRIATAVMIAFFALAPLVAYPVFLMKVMCFALFACAFNLLIGYGGLLSFGHAMFLGTAGYASAHAAKVWGFPPEFAILFGTACSALLAYVLSATLAGLAGATKVLVFELASLTDVHWTMSGEVVLMVLLGGLGTVFGPVVGALIIISMENYLAQIGSWVTVVQGVIFVICVLTFRRGVIGELGRLIKRPL